MAIMSPELLRRIKQTAVKPTPTISNLGNIPKINLPNLDFSKIPQGIKIPSVPNIPQRPAPIQPRPAPIVSQPIQPRPAPIQPRPVSPIVSQPPRMSIPVAPRPSMPIAPTLPRPSMPAIPMLPTAPRMPIPTRPTLPIRPMGRFAGGGLVDMIQMRLNRMR